ncbi:hypothetical protein E4U54_004320, partial [Claviceps lovelessii]
MPITILQPQPASQRALASLVATSEAGSDSDSDGGADLEGDVSMRAPKRRRSSANNDDMADEILTPGTVITTNPQWMR